MHRYRTLNVTDRWSANGIILQGLKLRIFDKLNPYSGKWVKELPAVLRRLHTNTSTATGQTPFSLVYGSEAVLPSKVNPISAQVEALDKVPHTDQQQMELIATEQLQGGALLQVVKYH